MHRRNAIYTPTPLTALFAFATHNFNIAGCQEWDPHTHLQLEGRLAGKDTRMWPERQLSPDQVVVVVKLR